MKHVIIFIFTVWFLSGNVLSIAVIVGGRQYQNVYMENIQEEIKDTRIVSVLCRPQQMCISMNVTWMAKRWSYKNIDQLALRENCDSPITQNETHVTICTENNRLLSCGTTFDVNNTHVKYSNNLTINDTDRVSTISPLNNRWFPWSCSFPVRLLVGVNFLPQISPITQFLGRQTGMGQFQVVMLLYQDNYTLPYELPPRLTKNDRILAEVKLFEGPIEAKLQVVQCWGTPGDQALGANQYPLIENYCPIESDAEVRMEGNGASKSVRWNSKVFQFINHTKVYLHCNVRVCFRGEDCTKTCDQPQPFEGRRRRDLSAENAIVSLGPISPATDTLIASATDIIIDDSIFEINKPANDLHKNLGEANDTFFGLPKLTVYAVMIVLSLLCVVFLVASITCVWKRKSNWKHFNIRNERRSLECLNEFGRRIDKDSNFSSKQKPLA